MTIIYYVIKHIASQTERHAYIHVPYILYVYILYVPYILYVYILYVYIYVYILYVHT
jgi:hypothetical protein